MYTHIAATRMYLFRVLWIDQVLPEPDRDSGSIRSLTMIKLLLFLSAADGSISEEKIRAVCISPAKLITLNETSWASNGQQQQQQ